jgi:hypothetical protein
VFSPNITVEMWAWKLGTVFASNFRPTRAPRVGSSRSFRDYSAGLAVKSLDSSAQHTMTT